jgi:hypothetical protein
MKTTLKKTRLKITEAVRSARLKLVEEALVPSVTFDTDVPGFALHVTTRKAFWGVTYQPRGINPATGKRWGGGTRHEIGDAYAVPLADTRAAARAVKANVSRGVTRTASAWPQEPRRPPSAPSSRRLRPTLSTPTSKLSRAATSSRRTRSA